jgi:TRAP-type C4-dicarboxylate transport system permease small subunit
MAKALSILTAILIVLAFVLRAIIPSTRFVPGGWPLGSHWYRASWVAFWFFLSAGIVTGLVLTIRAAVRGQSIW